MASSSFDLYSRARDAVLQEAQRVLADAHVALGRFLANIHANDSLASEALGQRSRKRRTHFKSSLHMACLAMSAADREFLIQRALDLAHARTLPADPVAVSVPESKFQTG
ncbi:unnamed protein product [Polarella glacialis]|uniref:Uncharacterized protein n=1 Tax=Polarella glacialis TaxID=89957 RepID=A0A813GTN0_POLGL|nr:unnamed protein product [Polarella glacialis]